MKTLFNIRRKAPKSLFLHNRFTPLLMLLLFTFAIMAFKPAPNISTEPVLMQGVVFEIEVTNHNQSAPNTETMKAQIQDGNLNMDVLPDAKTGRGAFIFNRKKGKNGEMTLVDHDRKEYYVIDDAFIESMVGNINTSKNMMEEAMKGLTKEQRDMIAKAQKQSGNKIPGMPGMNTPLPTPVTKNTGIRDNKEGYPCVKFETFLEGKKIRETWTTDYKNIDGGDEARNAFEGMNNFTERIKDNLGAMLGGNSPYKEMNLVNGFPVITREFEGGALENESVLKKTYRRTIDPDAFEPPSGYKRRTMGPR
jgi:hypothetical protein